MPTKVANLRDGWVDGGVYIGRAGRGLDGYFGNPYPARYPISREQSIASYRAYFQKRIMADAEFKNRIKSLRGKTLLCFCKPLACHGDVIKEFLDG